MTSLEILGKTYLIREAACAIVEYYRIACVRNDFIHKVTTEVSREFTDVCLEDLNVQGMLANHKLAKSIASVAWYEMRRQFEYKSVVHNYPRFKPSSCVCCECGKRHDLNYRIVGYPVPVETRSIEIGTQRSTKNRSGLLRCNACGDESSGNIRMGAVKLSPVKQELNVIFLKVRFSKF